MVSGVFEQVPVAGDLAAAGRQVSVLFQQPSAADGAAAGEPDYFKDLNLNRVVAAAVAGRDEEYGLAGFWHAPPADPQEVGYRQEAFRDLDHADLQSRVRAFNGRMRTVRRDLRRAQKLHYQRQREAWFLAAAEEYGIAARALAGDLAGAELGSRALRTFRDALRDYLDSPRFASLEGDTARVRAELDGVRYCLEIRDSRARVTRYAGEADYSREVEDVFARFREADVPGIRGDVRDSPDMDHVEAAVLDLVARLHPTQFTALEAFCRTWAGFLDPLLAGFDREVQFYLGYLEAIAPLRPAGLEFCYPQVSGSKQIEVQATFDLALALALTGQHKPVVCNDVRLSGAERLLVVTGPNQGGKTTFARTVGQLHYLAGLGCLVPGRRARLLRCDRIFTHFDRREDVRDLRSKLEDDLTRVRVILDSVTADSLVVLNEAFTSTTVADALLLGRRVLGQLIDADVLGVYVTFVDELAALHPAVVSMVATVDPDDPARRTYQVVRRPADGRAYAAALAGKHRLTRDAIRGRLA